MPAEPVSISSEEIRATEKILLTEGKAFDEERRGFIKDLGTLDLQAVPGSGKTTALLSKLLILDKQLPFSDSSGILVLSHTNNAVDEIRDRISPFCSNLFHYPNYVGTIQSFVDEFLAKPYYSIMFKRKIFKIDEGIYNNLMSDYYERMSQYPSKAYLSRMHNPKEIFQSLRFDSDMNLCEGFKNKPLLTASRKSRSYTQLLHLKMNVLQSGILHFDDAYFLAELYLQKYPKIKQILQERFRYVFVDEMQDMAPHQYDILEKIFFDEGNSRSVFQRIGDKNQAIYNGETNIEDCWVDRDIVRHISESPRLSPINAETVKYFGLTFHEIIGTGKNTDGSGIDIKPHMIVYDDNSRKCIVVQTFVSLVKELQESGKIPRVLKYPVKAVAWRKEHEDEHKTALKDYCPCFVADEAKPKVLYENLASYLHLYDKEKETLSAIRKNILNAFVHILRLERVKDSNDRFYTKKNLLAYLKENNPKAYNELKFKLYTWCMAAVRNKQNSILEDIRSYAESFISFVDPEKSCCLSRNFIYEEYAGTDEVMRTEEDVKCRGCFLNDRKIEMNTVHSVKGETHNATLYLESFYSKGYGNYESERLKNQFVCEEIKDSLSKMHNSHKIVIQSAKMAYVGFSRPTHLLCFAVHKKHFDMYLSDIDRNTWEVIDISN